MQFVDGLLSPMGVPVDFPQQVPAISQQEIHHAFLFDDVHLDPLQIRGKAPASLPDWRRRRHVHHISTAVSISVLHSRRAELCVLQEFSIFFGALRGVDRILWLKSRHLATPIRQSRELLR